MPVENEIKVVLKGDPKEIVHCMGMLGAMRQEINQIYTTPHNRFREIIATIEHEQHEPIYTHTYKHMIDGRLLEVEGTVTAEDWQLALPAALSGLYKTRYSWPSLQQHWDLDFLRTAPKGPRSSIYFMMAECELPEGDEMRLPSILEPHVDLVVPQQYNELFTNARLTDQQYARAVVEDFRASL